MPPRTQSLISNLQSLSRLARTAIHWLLLGVMLAACAGPTGTPSPVRSTPSVPTLAVLTPIPASPTPLPSPTPGARAFTIALPAPPDTLDPANAENESALLITRHLYEGLTQFEPGTTRAAPALAQAWETSADGLTWTFTLRPEVTFSDGTPLTAELVAQNFERWQTRTPPGAYRFFQLMFGGFADQRDETGAPLSNLATISTTAPSTLVLTLHRPDAALPNTLAMPAFAIVNPSAWSAPDFGQASAPSAGTGPFVLKAWRPVPDGLLELERNPNYWGEPPDPDTLVFKVIADDVQRVTALQVGEIDGLAGLDPQHYDVSSNWPIRVEFDPPLQVLYLGFNQARRPWGRLECRLAVAYALDKARYVREFFPGDAEPAQAMQPPGTFGYAAPLEDRAHDIEKAKELWDACRAGEAAPPPETIHLYVPPIPRGYLPDPANLGAALQADLASAGISVTVTSPDWATTWLPDVQAGRADLFLLGWYAANGDPDGYLCPLFCGANAAFNTDSKGLPIPPDAELAQLLQEARHLTDPAQREQLYAQAHARLFEAVPAIPLAYRKTAWAFRADLQGTVPSPIEAVFFNLTVDGGP